MHEDQHLTTEHIPLEDCVDVQSVYYWLMSTRLFLAVLLPLVKNTRNEQMYDWGYLPRWANEAYRLQLITSFS